MTTAPNFKLQKDLTLALRSFVRIIYIVCEEEDEVIKDIYTTLFDKAKSKVVAEKNVKLTSEVDNYFKVHTSYGLCPVSLLIRSWTENGVVIPNNDATISAPGAINAIIADNPPQQTIASYYFIPDPERWFNDIITVRRILHLQHICQNNPYSNKVLIFMGPQMTIPSKLTPYVQVIKYEKPSKEKLLHQIDLIRTNLNLEKIVVDNGEEDVLRGLSGFTVAEAATAIRKSIVLTGKHPAGDPQKHKVTFGNVTDFKMERLKKTNLLTLIDTSDFGFSNVGGLDRFKSYAERVRGSWTKEGRDFGLRPPKGILCVGMWGCGKSLSVKSLGSEWKLPTIQLEIGKLRSSAVGDTENNLYRALAYIEAMAPCIVWVDEADKSLSGVQSSGKSDSGTTARTIGILSTWYQETKADVCMVFTANNIESIPVEIINRVDDRFFFDIPSTEDLVEVLKIQLRIFGHVPPEVLSEWDLLALAKSANGLVPREVEQAIGQALRESFFQAKPRLDYEILKDELVTKPRILNTMEDEVQGLQKWVGYDVDRDEGVRAKLAASRKKSEHKFTVSRKV